MLDEVYAYTLIADINLIFLIGLN